MNLINSKKKNKKSINNKIDFVATNSATACILSVSNSTLTTGFNRLKDFHKKRINYLKSCMVITILCMSEYYNWLKLISVACAKFDIWRLLKSNTEM